jgi:ribosomal protein L16 Arg81 hydroxylase
MYWRLTQAEELRNRRSSGSLNQRNQRGQAMDRDEINDDVNSEKTEVASESSEAETSEQIAEALEADVKRDHLPHVAATG